LRGKSGRTLFRFLHEYPKRIFQAVLGTDLKALWKAYIAMQDDVRTPRNKFTHRAVTAKLMVGNDRLLAPRNPKKYSDWNKIFEVAGRQDIIDQDFAEVGELANTSINTVISTINQVWAVLLRKSGEQLWQQLQFPKQAPSKVPTIDLVRACRAGAQAIDLGSITSVSSCSASAVVRITPSTNRFDREESSWRMRLLLLVWVLVYTPRFLLLILLWSN
jgi:hypothetical protein